MGGAVGAFVAAAAMATGSAAPAKADFEELLDPIIQPLLTSVTDSLAGFDPTLATDLTGWTDSLLASLNSLDLAVPSAAVPAEAVPAAPNPIPSDAYIPITVQEDTEPTVTASIDGGSDQNLLVDTGSAGLVVPWDYLGSNDLTSLEDLFALGLPTGISESGYSGGVDYIYLEYNDATVDYGDGALTTTNTPIDVEILSWGTSSGSPSSFEQFLQDDDSTGILGIGDSSDAGGVGPTESPFEADGYDGVTVDIPNVPDALDEPDGDLIVDPVGVDSNPGTAIATLDGAPTSDLWESIDNGTPPVAISDDIDSGGVYGTIPSSLESGDSVPSGTTISVYDNAAGTGPALYSYTTGTDTPDDYSTAPEVVSGTDIDSGIEAFYGNPVYIDYTGDGGDGTLSYDNLSSVLLPS
jgi:hypothetical protein